MRTEPAETESWSRCIPCPVILVLGVLALIAGFGWIWHVVTNVFSGHALEHCCAIGGVDFDFVGAFMLLCGISVALSVAAVLQVRDWLQWRDLKNRYRIVRAARDSSGRAGDSREAPPFDSHDDGT